MAKCILHAGMHKTGSASIQNSLKNLDDGCFYYARLLGRPNHSRSLPSVFAERDGRQLMRKRFAHDENDVDERTKQARIDLRNSIEAADGRTLQFSGEGILHMPAMDLARLKNFLERHGYDDVTVIAYVRPPFGFISSTVQQKIRTGNSKALKFLNSAPDYQKKFAKFDDVFGADKVLLSRFEPAALTGKDVVADFCGKAGIPVSSIELVRKNASITRLAAQLCFQYAAHAEDEGLGPLRPGTSAALCAKLRDLDQSRFRMAPSVLKPSVDSLKPDIEWMERRLGQKLDEDMNDSEFDIRGEADLLQPIAGIQEKLRSLLSAGGEQVPGDAADNTWKLLHFIASTAAKPHDTEDERDVGGLGTFDKSKGRELARQTRKPDGIGGGNKERPTRHQTERHTAGRAGDASGGIAGHGAGPGRNEGASHKTQHARQLAGIPLTMNPKPLINKDKNLIVVWSPKSACTTTYVWFSHISGFANDVKNYASWPHRHRLEKYLKSDLYSGSAASGMETAKMLRIIRDPYARAVSIYRHALQTFFADKDMEIYSQGRTSAETGYSFQTFLDLLLQLDMHRSNIHFRPQYHSFEMTRTADKVINITKQDLFTELNQFEVDQGFGKTNFEDLNWLHSLESKRKAKQERVEGEGFDVTPHSRNQVANLGMFPSYDQLLTHEARQKIETIYKPDFDAYRNYL